MNRIGRIDLRAAACWAVLAWLALVPAAQALTFANPLPDEERSLGFDLPAPAIPTVRMSDDLADFLVASPDPADNPAVEFTVTNCFRYAGANGCQSSVPTDTLDYTGVTTWTVSQINIDVPDGGLFLFVGGMGNGDTEVEFPPAPDYPLGSVQVLTDGGDFGGDTLAPLVDGLFTFGGVVEVVYFGALVDEVGDSLTFGYQVDQQLEGGTPIFFSNAARNIVVIPEPGTALLVGLGLVALAMRGGDGRLRS